MNKLKTSCCNTRISTRGDAEAEWVMKSTNLKLRVCKRGVWRAYPQNVDKTASSESLYALILVTQ